MTVLALQRRLKSLGLDPGPLDGLLGPSTLRAVNAALDGLPGAPAAPPPLSGHVPADWMPWAQMLRIVFHWTAGGNKASATDREHYHILVEGDGKLVRGVPSIDKNSAPVKPGYAAHTLNLNSNSIGVSLCGMVGAKESPFDPGKSPITRTQWDALSTVLADLCRRYSIPVTRATVLSHAEVQPTLGVTQRGKWDIARLPWDDQARGALVIGNMMRAAVAAKL
jgi:N-acetyl-anhydromuramyl-L-alanine amidase AmpD